jgi:Ca2+-binding RTX toxin-like protein
MVPADAFHARSSIMAFILLPGGAGPDTLVGTVADEIFLGFDGDDVITGDGVDRADGGPGDDRLSFGDGANRLLGSDGNDTILAGGGGDTVLGGFGDDLVRYTPDAAARLYGGPGVDTLEVIAHPAAPLYFVVAPGGADDGMLSVIDGFERFRVTGGAGADFVALGYRADTASLGAGNDTAFGRDGNDTIWAGAGDDRVRGGAGDDLIFGGAGNDGLWGDSGADTLRGEDGDDWLAGWGGDDLLTGGTGADTLLGGLGNDTVTGGAGADLFFFTDRENGFDLITDFVSGEDRIDYWGGLIGFREPAGPVDPALFSVGTAVGTHAQFVLIYHAQHDETWLHWDDNGANPAGGTYGLIRFSGETVVTAADLAIWT